MFDDFFDIDTSEEEMPIMLINKIDIKYTDEDILESDVFSFYKCWAFEEGLRDVINNYSSDINMVKSLVASYENEQYVLECFKEDLDNGRFSI